MIILKVLSVVIACVCLCVYFLFNTVLAGVIPAFYCPHESEGFNIFPRISCSPFKTTEACIT